jgi:uncharacterized membrane protein HdeD (DUF308 family)
MNGRPWWQILLALWLIIGGVLVITNLTFTLAAPIMALLAIVAGIALLFGK